MTTNINNSYLGIDFGTSGVRACVIDDDKNIITEHRLALPAPEQNNGQISQTPRLWWDTLEQLLDQLSQHEACRRLRAIAIDGTAGTLLLTDENGEPLSDTLMYNDSSASDFVDIIRQQAPNNHVCISATSSLAKCLYLKGRVNPDNVGHVLHQSDWILGRLAEQYGISDENNSLKMGYDPKQRIWPDWAKSLINPDWLPTVYPAGTAVATIDSQWSKRWKLPEEIQLVTGTTDSTASVIATGISKPGQAVTVLGSTLVLKVLSDNHIEDSHYGVYSHRLGNMWLAGGASNSGGAVLKQHFSQEQLDTMTPNLKPEQPTNLDYYPLPGIGERFPVNDPTFLPRISPRPADELLFFQGLLEGMAAIEKQGYERLQALGAPYPEEIYSAGGGALNPGWRKIREQQLQRPVKIAQHQEAAYGCAILALRGMNT